jgi:hypothetical protein
MMIAKVTAKTLLMTIATTNGKVNRKTSRRMKHSWSIIYTVDKGDYRCHHPKLFLSLLMCSVAVSVVLKDRLGQKNAGGTTAHGANNVATNT